MHVHECITCVWVCACGSECAVNDNWCWREVIQGLGLLSLCFVFVQCDSNFCYQRTDLKDVRNFLNLVWNSPCFILGFVKYESVGRWRMKHQTCLNSLRSVLRNRCWLFSYHHPGFVSRTQRMWELLWQRYHPVLRRLETCWQTGNRSNLWLVSIQYLGILSIKNNLISLLSSPAYQGWVCWIFKDKWNSIPILSS